MKTDIAIEDFLRKIKSEHEIYEQVGAFEEPIYLCHSCNDAWTNEHVAASHFIEVQAREIQVALRGMFELGYDTAEKDRGETGFWGQGKRLNPYSTALTDQEAIRVRLGRPIWRLPAWVKGRSNG